MKLLWQIQRRSGDIKIFKNFFKDYESKSFLIYEAAVGKKKLK